MKVPLTINDFLDRAVAVYPDRVAIVDEPDQVAAPLPDITYGQLGDIRRQMGVAMDELGIPMGARVAMVSHNSARLLTSFFGVSGNGRIFVPINFRLSADEVAYIVEHSGAEVLLIDPELADDARRHRLQARLDHGRGVRCGLVRQGRRARGLGAGRGRHRVDQLHLGNHGSSQGGRADPPGPVDQRRDLRLACRGQRS